MHIRHLLLVMLSLAILFALAACPDAPAADSEPGFVPCGDSTCQPGTYCADSSSSSCASGCASRANCLEDEVCDLSGDIGYCVPVTSGGDGDGDGDGDGYGDGDGPADAGLEEPLDGGSSTGAPDGGDGDGDGDADGDGDVDAGPQHTGPSCGDAFCNGDETFASCPTDCPPAAVASCTAACEAVWSCDEEVSLEERTACLNACQVADDEQTAALADCASSMCSVACLDEIHECGDGRCEAWEAFDPNPAYCPADCGPEPVGFDCFVRCLEYSDGGCVADAAANDCFTTCFAQDEQARVDFLNCSSDGLGSLSTEECISHSCLEEFGVLCPDSSCGTCGDGTCAWHESYATCSLDCSSTCGDGFCTAYETCVCTLDCGSCETTVCGDGQCDASESCSSCSADCGACDAGCRSDYMVRKGPFINQSAGIGDTCVDASGQNCMDGTSITYPDLDFCFCSVLCASIGLNKGDVCVDSDGLIGHCVETANDYGDIAIICAIDDWGLCAAP